MNVIVTCNAGSSNFKLGVFDASTLESIAQKQFANADAALGWLSGQPYAIRAIAHRVVHGGRDFTRPTRITPNVLSALQKLIPLAPLHQPQALSLIETMMAEYDVPHIGCFDTAFHHTQDPIERVYAIPRHFQDEGIERYGFHGLSYQHVAQALPGFIGDRAKGKVIAAHLGGGSSMCAMENLESKASTMGFSTLEGLMMGTRCGALDAGVPLYLMQQGMDRQELENMLYRKSGMLGVSGISGHMDELEKSHAKEAKEAILLYYRMAAKQMGALIAVLGGIETLVFTGGIGEHSAAVREGICAYFSWLGLGLHKQKNAGNELLISAKESRIAVYIIPADEERVLAEACKATITP